MHVTKHDPTDIVSEHGSESSCPSVRPTPNDGLEEIYTQLLSTDPSQRPLLVDILDFTDRERVSPALLVKPDLYNHILLVPKNWNSSNELTNSPQIRANRAVRIAIVFDFGCNPLLRPSESRHFIRWPVDLVGQPKVNNIQPFQWSVDNNVGGLGIHMRNTMSVEESKPFHNLADELVALRGL